MSAWTLLEAMLPQLTADERDMLQQRFAHLTRQTWEKGSYLCHERQPFAQMVLIERGLIRSFYIDDDVEVNLRFLCDGSLAVPFAALAQAWITPPSRLLATETLQCVTRVTGYVLPVHNLLDQAAFPEFERLRTEMAARHYVSMEQRLRMIQHQRAIERYRKFLAWMPAPIVQDMPNFHIASYLGITPEVLSRVKQQLKTEGH